MSFDTQNPSHGRRASARRPYWTYERKKTGGITHEDKGWEKKDVFSVIGESTVRQAVNAGIVAELLYVSDCPIPFEKKTQVTPEVMEYITLGRKTSLVAICRKTEIPIPAGELHRILVLDRVEYRGNIGRMMYLAFCFGVDLVYYSEGDGTNYHARSIANASQGASFFLPARPANLPEKLRELKAQGWYIVGTSLRDAVPLFRISAHDKMVFVVGNEQVGVSEEVLQATDVNCRIEMENYDSLNVAIAAGILLHRFRIQEGRFSKTKRRFRSHEKNVCTVAQPVPDGRHDASDGRSYPGKCEHSWRVQTR